MLNHLQNGVATDPVSVLGICSKGFRWCTSPAFSDAFFSFMLLLPGECFVKTGEYYNIIVYCDSKCYNNRN